MGFILISFSNDSLLVYRNTTDFYLRILQPATLLNLLLLTVYFFVVRLLGFSIYKILSSEQRYPFTTFSSIWRALISFSCLIALN